MAGRAAGGSAASEVGGWAGLRRRAFAVVAAALLVLPAVGAAQALGERQLTASLSPVEHASGPYAKHLAQLINDYRARNGLAPLQLVADLNLLAAEHSAQMAEMRRLSHDGFRSRFDRTTARLCVENVGVNFPHAEGQLDGWRASPGHHRNLLEPKIARMGLARAQNFVTFFACS